MKPRLQCMLVVPLLMALVSCGGDGEAVERESAGGEEPAIAAEDAQSVSAGRNEVSFTAPVYPHGAALSPDGSRIAIAGGQEFGIWDVASGQAVRTDFAPLVVEDQFGSQEYNEALHAWWTTDGTVWFQFDLGIQGYDPSNGSIRATAIFPVLMGITSYDVSPDGRYVFMGQGMADFFVIHDARAGETSRIDFSVPSSTGMVGAGNARFSSDGDAVSVYHDEWRYFQVDGTLLDDPAAAFAGRAEAVDVAEGRGFSSVGAATGCRDVDGTIRCGSDGNETEVHTWGSLRPDGHTGLQPNARAVSADGSVVAELWITDAGGSDVRVRTIR